MPVPRFDDFVKTQPASNQIPTFDEFSQVVPGTERLGGQPPAAIGAKSPVPGGASVPAPIKDRPLLERAAVNTPRSLGNLFLNVSNSLGPTASPQPTRNPHAGEPDPEGNLQPEWIFPDPMQDIKNVWNTVRHPLESFAEDPIGTTALARGALEGGRGLVRNGPEIGAAAGGAAKGAVNGVRPLLSKFSPFGHPLKTLPDLYDFGVGIYRGAKQGLVDLAERRAATPAPAPVPLGPSRQLGRGPIIGGPVADASSVNVSTGEPLSYGGPRQLGPAAAPTPPTPPTPRQLSRGPLITAPPADSTAVNVTTGQPLSYGGPRQLGGPTNTPTPGLVQMPGEQPAGPPSNKPAASPTLTQPVTAPAPASYVPRTRGPLSLPPADSAPQLNGSEIPAHLANNPRALAAARALQQEMTSPTGPPNPGTLGRAVQRQKPSTWMPGSEIRGWHAKADL